jgi:hypothetical protein
MFICNYSNLKFLFFYLVGGEEVCALVHILIPDLLRGIKNTCLILKEHFCGIKSAGRTV